ncbi:MFS transporter [Dictyobacter kobayashii]|uniref:MFS transporter n=1 Tax=Dictyobacter kobayashii TaxID=2014872 RepID=A0A402AE12_9CHLR|nr:MFS transporter [Dictyobacter kobayashii]GCE17326.1 MFS transporter [Dictyobacter kobayashii]
MSTQTTGAESLQGNEAQNLQSGPTKPVKLPFQLLLSLANTVVWLSIIPLQQLLLPNQVAAIDPKNKVAMLSLVLSLSGITSVIAQPLAGAFSDRTTSRFGRRRPWILAGLMLTVISMVLLANAHSIIALVILFSIFGLVMGMILSPLLAIIPDMVPVKQRAVVSAFVGLAQPLGILIGIILIAQVIKSTQTSYYVIAGILTVVLAIFLLVTREEPLAKDALPPFSWKEFFTSFFSPLKSADYRYTWIARFLVILAQTVLVEFILYYLQDVIHYDRLFPGQTADQGVAMFQGIETLALIVSTIVSGIISDKLQRRKPFVIAASLIMTVALFLIAFVPSWPVVLAVAVIFGIGFGTYLSSDIALATQVLPKAQSQGKDLGLITAANILPELLFPLIAAIAFSLFNGYPAAFAIAGIATLLGAVIIIPIKSVR